MGLIFQVRGTQSVTLTKMPKFHNWSDAEIAERLSDGELSIECVEGRNVIKTEKDEIVARLTDFEFAGMRKDFDGVDLV